MENSKLVLFEQKLKEALTNGQFVKLSLGNYKGDETELKNIYAKLTLIKKLPQLAFNYRFKTRDTFKNFDIESGIKLIIDYLSTGFKIATLFTADKEIIIEYQKNGELKIRENTLATKLVANLSHDKEKKRLISAKDNVYLHQLGLTDVEGNVFKKGQDKYKQINQYIEILSSLIKELPVNTIRNVADMGSGKGYLTFALYDYLQQQNIKAQVTGVEYRKDMVELCNTIAVQSEFKNLNFVEGTIQDFDATGINLLIALHACDTATDDAIYKGIKANAELIVVAPCCHKQIRREIEKGKVTNDVSFLTQYGIFLERQAEMVTDGIRALILEYFGYKTKVLEFISDAHTPKNVLVVGVKSNLKGAKNKDEILEKIKSTKAYFGIGHHHLEKLLAL